MELPLNKEEVMAIMDANKRGFLGDDAATELLQNPAAARAYLNKGDFEANEPQ